MHNFKGEKQILEVGVEYLKHLCIVYECFPLLLHEEKVNEISLRTI